MRTEASNQLTVAHMGVRDYIDGEFNSILASPLGFLPSLDQPIRPASTSGGIVTPICFAVF
jgi:hypothetical protein